MSRTKLAPGSLLTVDDQVKLYEEVKGAEAAERQVALANLKAGRCSCQPSTVRRRWEDSDKPTSRRVHAADCPKWKPWMGEAQA